MNHLDLVGWVNTARYKWAEIMGREIKFKPATFYLGIADHLARVVEHQGDPHDSPQIVIGHGKDAKERAELEEIRQEGERVEMAESLKKGNKDAIMTRAKEPRSQHSSHSGQPSGSTHR